MLERLYVSENQKLFMPKSSSCFIIVCRPGKAQHKWKTMTFTDAYSHILAVFVPIPLPRTLPNDDSIYDISSLRSARLESLNRIHAEMEWSSRPRSKRKSRAKTPGP